MKITGIIVEYNPLHNGHLYHIQKTKEITKCDLLVAIMSGNFVQRGEPAIFDKWARTETALLAGIDLVIELPYIYSTSSAEGFAFGAVSLLHELKQVDMICFGSELGDIKPLEYIAEVLSDEPSNLKNMIRQYINLGLPYAKARELALLDYFKNSNVEFDIKEILKNSNNILAIEYIKALKKLSSKIKPVTVKRIKNQYNQTDITSSIASATAIRYNFNNDELIKTVLPDFTYKMIQREKNLGKGPVKLSSFSDVLLYKIRTSPIEFLKSIQDVSEGLEYKIKRAAEDYTNIEDMINATVSKRYPKTRIQRVLLNILMNITKDIYSLETKQPKYIRVLGATKKGRTFLKESKEIIDLPLITNVSRNDKELLTYDIDASNIYVLGYKNDKYKMAMSDLKRSPILIE